MSTADSENSSISHPKQHSIVFLSTADFGEPFYSQRIIFSHFPFSKGSADFGELPAEQKSSFQEKLNLEVHSRTPWPSFWAHFGIKMVNFFEKL